MSRGPTLDAGWLARLRAGADRPPRLARVPLWAGTSTIGSVEPDFLDAIAPACRLDGRPVVARDRREGVDGWAVHGDLTPALAQVAFALRDAGLAHVWRNEQLGVPDAQGRRVATVERAVVRPLGLTTQAVHLVGVHPDGRHWIQQRSLSKPNDPGLWDTLMGGMISAADSLAQALARETWEEAGLRMDQVQGTVHAGRVVTRRPSDDAGGAGYVIEAIDWFVCTVPDGVEPRNQDGEVERFVLMDDAELGIQLHADGFTTEAALILADYLRD